MIARSTAELLHHFGLPPDATTQQALEALKGLSPDQQTLGRELLVRLANAPCPTCLALGTVPNPRQLPGEKEQLRCPDCAGSRIKPR